MDTFDGISDQSRAYLTGVTCSWGSRSTCKCNIRRQNDARKSYGTISSAIHLQNGKRITKTAYTNRNPLTSKSNWYPNVVTDCSGPSIDDSSTYSRINSIDGDNSPEWLYLHVSPVSHPKPIPVLFSPSVFLIQKNIKSLKNRLHV